MKELKLKYLGNKDKLFLFLHEEEDALIRFNHVRSDLIHEFHLMKDLHINAHFNVKFFITTNKDVTQRIISDLILLD